MALRNLELHARNDDDDAARLTKLIICAVQSVNCAERRAFDQMVKLINGAARLVKRAARLVKRAARLIKLIICAAQSVKCTSRNWPSEVRD